MTEEPGRVVLRATDVRKEFRMGDATVSAVDGVSLSVNEGELVAILGASGSGKRTLLGLLGGLDNPTSGRVEVGGVDITSMSEGELAEIRNEKIGFVFQFFNLIQTLTAVENVELPIQFSRNGRSHSRKRAEELLSLLGLDHRLDHRPGQLSGGEQQRVAIARALANGPDLILADEPTGNLDSGIGQAVLQALLDARTQTGTTLVLVTHDSDVAALADRSVTMKDGVLID
ncbi:MAG: ABC transporter ATP-binding protein [Chloroflexi bacterium]|nr:ABC transporter ATP-binding protein [Chloroflexota bacterium]